MSYEGFCLLHPLLPILALIKSNYFNLSEIQSPVVLLMRIFCYFFYSNLCIISPFFYWSIHVKHGSVLLKAVSLGLMIDLYEVVTNLQCGLMTVICLFDRFRGFFWKAARIGGPLFRCFTFTTIFVGLVHNYSPFSSFHFIFILIFICYLLGTISFASSFLFGDFFFFGCIYEVWMLTVETQEAILGLASR